MRQNDRPGEESEPGGALHRHTAPQLHRRRSLVTHPGTEGFQRETWDKTPCLLPETTLCPDGVPWEYAEDLLGLGLARETRTPCFLLPRGAQLF